MNDPLNYYYTFTKTGQKSYYTKNSRNDFTRISVKQIPQDILSEIKEIDLDEKVEREYKIIEENLKEKKRKLEEKLKSLQDQLNNINLDKEQYRSTLKEEFNKNKNFKTKPKSQNPKLEPKKSIPLREEYKIEDPINKAKRILQELNIKTKREWKSWLLLNHSDKLINLSDEEKGKINELVKDVNSSASIFSLYNLWL